MQAVVTRHLTPMTNFLRSFYGFGREQGPLKGPLKGPEKGPLKCPLKGP